LGRLPLETRRSDGDTRLKPVRFNELRDDWYRGVDLMTRLVARASGGEPICFHNFPRQWLPLFALWRVEWQGSVDPPEPLPIISDLDEATTASLIEAAKARGQLRTLVEVWVALDPLLADVLYRLDRRRVSPETADEANISLTGWQSYGRAAIQAFDALVTADLPVRNGGTAVLLPCARGRPYQLSRTHKRIWRELASDGVDASAVYQIVISSIGVVPEAHWAHPVVLAYDSGVPDIWRVLRLMRAYFTRNRFTRVFDCLQFEPYSEAVAILAREGLFGEVIRRPVGRPRRLPAP